MKGSTLVKLTAIIATIIVTAASAIGMELPESPVHQAMRADLMTTTWLTGIAVDLQQSDEFGGAVQTSGKKSVMKAAVFSALVPGGGQLYMGNKRTARYFLTAEVLTWLGYAAFRTYGDWRKDDYINYAAEHANAQLDGKSDDFVDLVGFYSNIRDYNAFGRAYDPQRPYLFDTPENHWEWQSGDERREFRTLKNRSREAYRRADFMIGVAIVDRVISVIDAVRSASRYNRRIGGSDFSAGETDGRLRLSIDPLHNSRQVSLTLYPGF